MMKKFVKLTTTLALVALLGACQQNGESARKNASEIQKENTVQNANTKASMGEGKTQYPLTIKTWGSDGSELETVYTKSPEKVLAVYQGSIETLLALGLEDRIVAASGLDNAVPENQKAGFSKLNYLTEFAPSLEKAASLEPDMIFSWGSLFGEKTLGNAKDWVDKKVNIYVNSNTRRVKDGEKRISTLENEYTDILNIGKIFDVQSKAEAIVKDMQDTIKKVIDKTKDMKEKPSVLVLENEKDAFRNYGSNTLGGDMVTKLGGQLKNADVAKLGKEDLIAANPDVIFVVYMPYEGDDAEKVKQENLDKILKDESLASLNAIKNKRVVPIFLSEMYASATRTKDGIISFAKGLYPSIDLGMDK
ncbi:ABC transporter substrate-binding protein [Granulicatella sp. zg-ZJ]|nr:ABC transporter substrate-binding protein [Granulicatella sp. zg-ZJ]